MNEPHADPELEPTLRAMQWRKAAPEFLPRSLALALAERCTVESAAMAAHQQRSPQKRTLLCFMPPVIRWPLAACWLLSLFFRITTPDPVPASVRESLAKLPAVDPAVMLAQLDDQHRLLAELIEQLHRCRDDPAVNFIPGRSPLP